ncbi:MAG TPA: carbohydrate-binding protein [Micromonosporaceae bacterium]
MRRNRILALASASALTVAGAAAVVVGFGGSAQAASGLTSNWYGSAPYVMPLDNNPPNLTSVMSATGQKAFELAFILAPNGGGCTPTWGGTANVSSDTNVANQIAAVRAAGGDVSVSIGGYGGTKLGQVCSSVDATAAAYQQVITKYSLHAIDFDLEEPEYENTTAVNNEIGAAKELQQNNPGLYVTVTVPGTTSGTGYFGQNVLNTAKADGFTPASFGIMPFDGGFNGASSQISALELFHTMLVNTFGWSSATAYNHEGVSQMNGRSDTGEIFTQTDFQTMLTYATGHGLSRYTFWAVNRDLQCSPPDNNGQTSGTCSSVTQNAYDFTKFTTQFAGATPPTTIPTAPPTTTPPGSCTAAAWVAGTAYNGGAVVSYGGHQWTAKWWTQGDIPGNNGQGVWTDNGPCSGGGGSTPTPTPTPTQTTPTPTPTPTPTQTGTGNYPAWVANHAYAAGALVSYGGHNYKCLQAHTSLVGWEPPNVPALWQLLS